MVYRHCTECGRGYDQKSWQRESFCGSCGWPLKQQLSRDDPVDILPYPERPAKQLAVRGTINGLCYLARKHPLVFSVGAFAVGFGGILLGATVVALGHGIMVAGGILFVLGIVSLFGDEAETGAKGVAGGLLVLAAGAGIVLVGHVLTVGGIIAIVAGTGVAVKVAVEAGLRMRIEWQLKQKSVAELMALSNQLEN